MTREQWSQLVSSSSEFVRGGTFRLPYGLTPQATDGKEFSWRFARADWPITRACTTDKCLPCNRDDDGCWFPTIGHTYKYGTSWGSKHNNKEFVLKSKMRAGSGTVMVEYIIELRCNHSGEIIKMSKPTYNRLENGDLKWYFNKQSGDVVHVSEKEMPQEKGHNSYTTEAKKLLKLGISFGFWKTTEQPIQLIGKKGVNTLRLAFTRRNMDQDAKANIAHFELAVDPEFTKCEDKQVCLSEMADGENWPQGASDLKESLHLQYVCMFHGSTSLEGPWKRSSPSEGPVLVAHVHADLQSSCERWTNCLERSGMLGDVKSILIAFGAQNAPQLTDYMKSAPTSSQTFSPTNEVENQLEYGALTRRRRKAVITVDTKCRDPWLTDPEAWVCVKCDEMMKQKCASKGYAKGECGFDACLRDLLCTEPAICKTWKDANCPVKSHCYHAQPQTPPPTMDQRRRRRWSFGRRLLQIDTHAGASLPEVDLDLNEVPEGASLESHGDRTLVSDRAADTSDRGARQHADSLVDVAASVDMGLCAGWGAG